MRLEIIVVIALHFYDKGPWSRSRNRHLKGIDLSLNFSVNP